MISSRFRPMASTRALKLERPDVSFGPLRFAEAVPWLMLALACRITGMNGSRLWVLALIGDSLAVLMAFMAVARRVFELSGRPSSLDGLSLGQEFRLGLRIFGRMALLMIAATALVAIFGGGTDSSICLLGLDGMAFGEPMLLGKISSAMSAALVLLLILGIERGSAKPDFAALLRGARKYGVRFAAAVAILVLFYVVIGFIQPRLFDLIWQIEAIAVAEQRTKNLIYFGVQLGFATIRLWATLLILSLGLKSGSTLRRDGIRLGR